MTSDWGNKLFLTAGKKVADSLFTGASSMSESDLGDRMESAFNLSFWAKEGAFDWSWLGLNLENERKADELLVSLEWQCYRESEQQMVCPLLRRSHSGLGVLFAPLDLCRPVPLGEDIQIHVVG